MCRSTLTTTIRCFRETARDLDKRVEQLVSQNTELSAPLGIQLEEIRDEISKILGEINIAKSKT